jgi:hypothetical protein
MVRIHLLCLLGLRLILALGKKRYGAICNVLKFTSVMPAHKNIGKKNYNAIKRNNRKYEPLMRHFEYLKNLCEVRSTRVVATLVNGMQGHANCNDSLDVTYPPISLGYQSCYKRYMALLGYVVLTTAMGAFIVTGEDGKEVDACEYCSFSTYFNLWKRDFPELKESWLVEDICKDCYTFANHHRYLANHSMGCNDDDGNGDVNGNGNGNDNNNGNGERSSDGCSNDDKNDNGSKDVFDVGVCPLTNIDLNRPEAASTKEDEERELMLLQAAVHIKWQGHREPSTRQRQQMRLQMQQQGKKYLVRRYTFVVDYRQNMELPMYNKEQPGCTY